MPMPKMVSSTSPHVHQTFIDGCYPCDLLQRMGKLRAENERLRAELDEMRRHYLQPDACECVDCQRGIRVPHV